MKEPVHFCNGDVNPKVNTFFVAFVSDIMKESAVVQPRVSEHEVDVSKNKFRSKLSSESSVDSEDSYDIVFQSDSDLDDSESESDSENVRRSSCWSDKDTTDEDEEEEKVFSFKKVTFNLHPIIHQMIQWNFAYRAARKGPWEEMARDRERFKFRVNSVGRALNPIFTKEHRSSVWLERFSTGK